MAYREKLRRSADITVISMEPVGLNYFNGNRSVDEHGKVRTRVALSSKTSTIVTPPSPMSAIPIPSRSPTALAKMKRYPAITTALKVS